MINVNFHEISEETESLIYSVMVTFSNGKLVTVRHKERNTWEMPGGHIETGETPDEAAARELVEETGAVNYTVAAVCDYSVAREGGEPGYGRLYHCEVSRFGPLGDSEIAEVQLTDELPDNLTYAAIQPQLLAYVKAHM